VSPKAKLYQMVSKMTKHSKRYQLVQDKVDRQRRYGVAEAINLVNEMATANFDETVEVAVKLGADPAKGDQTVRGSLVLPHGTGKVPRVAVFAEGEIAKSAEEAGADRTGGEDLIAAIEEGWEDFDVLVAHPAMMGEVGKRLGRLLGPRMPNKKAGNITEDVATVVTELKSGKVEYRMDRGGVVHILIGKVSFTNEQLTENLVSLLQTINQARPAAVTGRFIRSVAMSSSMGPGIKLDLDEVMAQAP